MKTAKIVLINIVMFFAFVHGAYAITYTAIQTGIWGDNTTWDSKGQPGANGFPDTIIVNDGVELKLEKDYNLHLYTGAKPFIILVDGQTSNTAKLNLQSYTLSIPDLSAIQLPNNVSGVTNGTVNFINLTDNSVVTSTTITNQNGPYAIKSSNGALPIELISFSAKSEQAAVYINWKTASETNSDYFDIERSADGINWEVLGRHTAAGNSNTLLDYSFIDKNPLMGDNYYRLYQVDFDGEFEYFGPIYQYYESNKAEAKLCIYPNPNCEGFLNMSLSQTVVYGDVIEIFNYSGELVYTKWLEGEVNQLRINISELPKGLYFVRYTGESLLTTEKLIIQ